MGQHRNRVNTSWEVSAKAYTELVGKTGSYYHQEVIFPNLIPLMDLQKNDTVLELGCGQGVLSRILPAETLYFGLDTSQTLLDQARELSISQNRYFKQQDVTYPFQLTKTNFTRVVIMLALQNMKNLSTVIANARKHLHPKGKLIIILNHPAFRIPKHSEWHTSDTTQSRLVHRYMSPLKIEIDMNPGNPKSTQKTWSFHHSISDYMHVFKTQKLLVEDIQEWVSNKVSVGRNAKRENVARAEFPMFMCWVLRKYS
jgi:SAM-dependent methyltransferase